MNHWMTKYTVIIEKNPVTGCYVGQCKQIPEAFSQGRTVEELMANMKEAVSLANECREEDLSAE
ncbi:MAG: type II toxin-antitoxin system HicB family antitoxin [Bacteroidales bacterium]|nr:type II toxin-antitoxin system HicB family antitoxin [Bacteroidales bacterium]